MRNFVSTFSILCIVLALGHIPMGHAAPKAHSLVIIIDGLRPDYIQSELMPTLRQLKTEGAYGQNHHSVFPTVTRVNSTSISTGCYPAKHGIMGNTVYFPEVNPKRGISTSDYKNLVEIDEAMGGNLVTAKTTGEYLQDAGKKLVAVSSGSTGSAFLLNHKLAGGAVLNNNVTLPASLEKTVYDILGPPAEDAYPNIEKVQRCADLYLQIALDDLEADAVFMWLTDPDHTAHKFGIGHPTTLDALRNVDKTLQRILEGLEERGMREHTNILITADHGFTTYAGVGNPLFTLRDSIRELRLNPNEVKQVGTAIYLEGEALEQIDAFAERLQQEAWVGAVFSAPSNADANIGKIPGTLSTGSVQWNHERAGQLLLSTRWNDDENEFGYKGATLLRAVGAGHGSSASWDIHIPFIGYGPAFKQGKEFATPSSNVDIAPTILHLLGLPHPDTMDGRILKEALKGGPTPDAQQINSIIHKTDSGASIQISQYGKHHYVDWAKGKP